MDVNPVSGYSNPLCNLYAVFLPLNWWTSYSNWTFPGSYFMCHRCLKQHKFFLICRMKSWWGFLFPPLSLTKGLRAKRVRSWFDDADLFPGHPLNLSLNFRWAHICSIQLSLINLLMTTDSSRAPTPISTRLTTKNNKTELNPWQTAVLFRPHTTTVLHGPNNV